MLVRLTGSDSPTVFWSVMCHARARRRHEDPKVVALDVAIAAVRGIPVRDETEHRLYSRSRDTAREASWRLVWCLMAVIRIDQKESSFGVHLRGVESHAVVSPLMLLQPAHVARLGLEDRPAQVRVKQKVAPIALRRGAGCKAEEA